MNRTENYLSDSFPIKRIKDLFPRHSLPVIWWKR